MLMPETSSHMPKIKGSVRVVKAWLNSRNREKITVISPSARNHPEPNIRFRPFAKIRISTTPEKSMAIPSSRERVPRAAIGWDRQTTPQTTSRMPAMAHRTRDTVRITIILFLLISFVSYSIGPGCVRSVDRI